MLSLVSVTHLPFRYSKFLRKMLGRRFRGDEVRRWFVFQSCCPRLMLAGIMVCLTTLFLWGEGSLLQAQELEDLKTGVVKITATAAGQQRVGTGFIVKMEDKTAYILTASHVVEGAALTVNFFPNPDKDYAGTTRNMQGGNPKGLAVIKVQGTLPNGIRSLELASNFAVEGGERATIIGFRRSPSIQWGVLQGILTGQTGADLIVSGVGANEGNSGGPIFVNEKVVGVMTEVFDDIGYAVPASITQIILKGWGIRVEPTISSPDRVEPSDAIKSDGKSLDVTEKPPGQDKGSKAQVPVGGATTGSPTVLLPGEAQDELPQGGEDVDHAVALAPGAYIFKRKLGGDQVEVFKLALQSGETLVVTWRTPVLHNAFAGAAIHDMVGAIQVQGATLQKKSQVESIQYQADDGGTHYVSVGAGTHRSTAGTVYKISILPSPSASRSDTSSPQPHSTRSATTSSPAVLLPGEAQDELPQGGEDVDHAVALAPGAYIFKRKLGGDQVEVFKLALQSGETLVVTWRTPVLHNAFAGAAIHDMVGAIQVQGTTLQKKSQVESIQYQADDGGTHYVSVGAGTHRSTAGTVYKISILPSPSASRSDTSSPQPHSTRSATTSSPAVLLPGEAQDELPQGGEDVDHAVALAPGAYIFKRKLGGDQVEVFKLALQSGETLVVTWRTPVLHNAFAGAAIHDMVGAIQVQGATLQKKSQVESIQYQADDGGTHYVSVGAGTHRSTAGTVYKISILPSPSASRSDTSLTK